MTQMYVQGGGCTPCLSPNMWPSVKDRGNLRTISYVRDSGLPLQLVAMVRASKVPQKWGQDQIKLKAFVASKCLK